MGIGAIMLPTFEVQVLIRRLSCIAMCQGQEDPEEGSSFTKPRLGLRVGCQTDKGNVFLRLED